MPVSGVMVGDPIKFIAAWVLFSFAAASIARNKNRSFFRWFIIGLLLGPFAALAVGLMKPGQGPDQGYN